MLREENSNFIEQKKIVLLNLYTDVVTVAPVIVVAILSESLVLATDIFDYIFSIFTSVLSLFVLKRCIKNERGKYDYGFGKLESLTAISTSSLMLIFLLILAYRAFNRIIDTLELDSTFVIIGIIMQGIGFFINGYLWMKAKRVATESSSPIMESQWRINKISAIGNLFIIISLAIGFLFSQYEWSLYVDPISAFFLIIIASKSFIALIKQSLADVLDHTLEEPYQLIILKRLAEHEEGYERFYDVQSRRSGRKVFIEISIGFDPIRKVGDALDISGRIKERIEDDIPNSEVHILIRSIEEFEETLVGKTFSGSIAPLTERHLEECIEIAKTAFPTDDIEKIKLEFLTSIFPNKFKKELSELGLLKTRYWVGILDNKVSGFVGMNYIASEPDVVWGGWMASESGSSKKDLRMKMYFMWKLAYEARQTGRKYFRLYTSSHPNEAAANKMYDNVGLNIYKTEKIESYDIYYREGEIVKLYEAVRPGRKRHYRNINA